MKKFYSEVLNEKRSEYNIANTKKTGGTAMIGEKLKNGAENIASGIKKIGKRNIMICVSVFVIAAAICLNWALYAGMSNNSGDDLPTGGDQSQDQPADNGNENVTSYFASVQISRQQARDEALEVLQLVIDSDSALESAKAEAIADVSRIADEIAAEANIETLIRAKGFEDCVAVISDGLANIVVKTDSALMQNEIAQIIEIVYEQANIYPENIRITEKY